MEEAAFKTQRSGWTILALVAVLILVIAGIAWRFVVYYRMERRPIVSLFNEWSAHGMPVDVCELKRGTFKIWRRTTATPMDGGLLHAFVTKHRKDRIRVGQSALIDLRNLALPARVTSVSNVRDIDTGLYEVRFCPNDSSSLSKAPFYHVRVNTRTIQGALVVPIETVQGMGDRSFVWAFDGEKVRRMPVEMGFSDGVSVLLSSDVGPTEFIVTDGFENLVEDLRVQIHATSVCAADEE